jgi:murein L,D-transpeptidase YcbB/YkuD
MPIRAVFCLFVLMVAALSSAAVAEGDARSAAPGATSGAADTASAENQRAGEPVAPAASAGQAASAGEPAAADPAASQAPGVRDAAPAPAAAQPSQTGGAQSDSASIVEENPIRAELLRQIEGAKLGKDEKSALAAFYESRQAPVWVEAQGFTAKARRVTAEIARADDWGLNASQFALPSAPEPGSPPAVLAEAELKLMQAVLKYARHARGGRMDPTDLSYYIDRAPPLLAPEAVLEGIASADAPEAYLRKLHPQHPQFEKLRQAYLSLRKGGSAEPAPVSEGTAAPQKDKRRPQAQAAAPERITAQRVLINMEQWRWMPENLGRMYVWANIPEFMLRVVKDGAVVHAERIVAGKPDTQTPIFSDEMETIVFHPFWGVPDSIKVKELLPGLARGSAVLEKNGLRVQYRGRDIDPSSVDWTAVDIRNFHIYQPPGGANVLGVVKFLFPNKHQVYMHDTPTKNLFNATQRSFSHGCMRVRNPLRLAEVLLAEDKGWDARKVAALVDNGPKNNEIGLARKIPVHVTYFTVWVDDDGKLNARPDVYGHERLIQMGLEGKAHLIVKRKEDLGVARAEVVGRLAETKPNWGGGGSTPSWVKNLFNF